MNKLWLVLLVLLTGCPPTGYSVFYANVTHYSWDPKDAKATPGGVRYIAPAKDAAFVADLDKKTTELKACLAGLNPKWVVRTDWFLILVPSDWYVSACSGQQLVPSTPACSLCIDQKGLPLPEKCCGLAKPTVGCPCVCNVRATIQDNYVIVTAPNLLLYKAELARLVTGVNNVWTDAQIVTCVR